jgi:hypothetical protein
MLKMRDVRQHHTLCFTIIVIGFFFFASQSIGGADPLSPPTTGPEPSTGQKIASGALTMLYFPAKVAYAGAGGIVGGLAYVFSGGDRDTAEIVWTPTIKGTYVLTPEHLWGDEPIEFFGQPESEFSD